MKNLLTVLKKLGKKMTDQDITGTNLVTVVDDIANKYTGGSGGGGECDCTLVVGVTRDPESTILDKTWQEIYDAMAAGKHVIINEINLDNGVTHTEINSASIDGGAYIVEAIDGTQFGCATPSDYPSIGR